MVKRITAYSLFVSLILKAILTLKFIPTWVSNPDMAFMIQTVLQSLSHYAGAIGISLVLISGVFLIRKGEKKVKGIVLTAIGTVVICSILAYSAVEMQLSLDLHAGLQKTMNFPIHGEKYNIESELAKSSAMKRHEISKVIARERFVETGEIISIYDLQGGKILYCPVKKDIDQCVSKAVMKEQMTLLQIIIKQKGVSAISFWLFVLFVSIFAGLIWKRI